jgi:hypothetical protein
LTFTHNLLLPTLGRPANKKRPRFSVYPQQTEGCTVKKLTILFIALAISATLFPSEVSCQIRPGNGPPQVNLGVPWDDSRYITVKIGDGHKLKINNEDIDFTNNTNEYSTEVILFLKTRLNFFMILE